MIETIGIPIAFAIFSSMALWIIIGCRGYWFAKALFIMFSMYFSVCLWNSLDSLAGWPSSAELPEEFEIKWIYADESGSKAVYVWAVDLHPDKLVAKDPLVMDFNLDPRAGVPRVHKLPYSRELHQQSLKIQKQIGQGRRFFAKFKKNGMEGSDACDACGGSGKKGGEGKGKGGSGSGEKCDKCGGTGKHKGFGKGKGKGVGDGGSLSRETDGIFHELPPPNLPQKVLNPEDYAGQVDPTQSP